MSEIMDKYKYIIDGVTNIYTLRKNANNMLNRNNIAFFETIISQKIMFYDILALYFYKDLYFFINNGLGADKIVTGETIQIIKELNEFYKLW